MYGLGKMLVLMGVMLLVMGGLLMAWERLFHLGRLPGDILIHKGNFTFYFPIVTSIILSILLTIILNLVFRR
ncbi:MAG: DUF2905 domain-containing protein [Thermoanaerobacteraceae bacterium]|uniref:DUF2905 family protein n=1 Tax=Desulfofundulus thermobenzoicus TaxID=29376 RepID=A0A6N7IUF1_9FIRM|nr:DUF2905 domain-containing protein [Desulfofundulus thermobenzoicus]MBE3588035.1 DUF2905 domain-containing protein [Thermoanaerobacteraceae bacterium]MQL53700.1 DUF2905 family protein [Desulfofundulus thermobenzoicus]HHW42916.1 DUF2905 domain-containing protein [Desulfotomaculum sp.]